jgi:hypothetical protein
VNDTPHALYYMSLGTISHGDKPSIAADRFTTAYFWRVFDTELQKSEE